MLEQKLRDELVSLQELHQLLDQEYQALRQRDVAALERLAGEKQSSAERLRQLGIARDEFLRNQGFSADHTGLLACIAADANPEAQANLQKLLEEFAQAAEQARNQNEINGAVIATSRGHVEQLLAIISGREPLEFLYGQDRRKVFNSNSGGQPIAKA